MFKKYTILTLVTLLTSNLGMAGDGYQIDPKLEADFIELAKKIDALSFEDRDNIFHGIRYTKADVDNDIYKNPYFRTGSMLTFASLCANHLLDQNVARNRNITKVTDSLLIASLTGTIIKDIKYGTVDSFSFISGGIAGAAACSAPFAGDICGGIVGLGLGYGAGYLGGVSKKLIKPNTNLNRWTYNGGVAGAHVGAGFGFAAGTAYGINILVPEVGSALVHIRPDHALPKELLK